jgi:hypothetical protein
MFWDDFFSDSKAKNLWFLTNSNQSLYGYNLQNYSDSLGTIDKLGVYAWWQQAADALAGSLKQDQAAWTNVQAAIQTALTDPSLPGHQIGSLTGLGAVDSVKHMFAVVDAARNSPAAAALKTDLYIRSRAVCDRVIVGLQGQANGNPELTLARFELAATFLPNRSDPGQSTGKPVDRWDKAVADLTAVDKKALDQVRTDLMRIDAMTSPTETEQVAWLDQLRTDLSKVVSQFDSDPGSFIAGQVKAAAAGIATQVGDIAAKVADPPGRTGPPGGHGTTGPPGGQGTTGPPGGHETTGPPGGHETTGPPGGHETTGPPGGHETTGPPGGHETTGPHGGHEGHGSPGHGL